MMRRTATAVLILAATSASGAPIAVTSGDHQNYTRLVFKVDPKLDWHMQDGMNSSTLVIEKKAFTFDGSAIFKRISRARLASIQQSRGDAETRFEMTLACDCTVNAFPYQDNFIVVDIRDHAKPPEPDPVYENLMHDMRMVPLPPSVGPTTSRALKLAARFRNPPPLSSPDSLDGPPPREPDGLHAEGPTPSNGTATHEDLAAIVDDARQNLLEQLTLASETGLVSFDSSAPRDEQVADPALERPVPPEDTFAQETPIPAPPAVPLQGPQISISTVFQRDSGEKALGTNVGMQNCPTDAQIDISAWGGSSFSAKLADLRTKLMGEFDKPNPVAARDIVRLYIRYGFGAEAILYLRNYGDAIQDGALLVDMAHIMDGTATETNGPISLASECNGDAGMWSIIGAYPDVRAPVSAPETIVARFAELTADVRRILGPRLEAALAERGHNAQADRVSKILDRVPGPPDSLHLLNMAQRAVNENNPEKAKNIYATVIDRRADGYDSALIKLAQMELESGDQASQPMIDDLGAAANESRGTNVGARLRRLQALWMAKSDGGMPALDLISREIILDAGHAASYENIVADIFDELSPDITGEKDYVESVGKYANILPKAENRAATVQKIATTLTNLGLPNMVPELLKPQVEAENPEAQLLAAKSYLANFAPEKAIAVLRNARGSIAEQIRVQAFITMGDFHSARQHLLNLELADTFVIRPGWYRGDWVAAEQKDEDARALYENYLQHKLPVAANSSAARDSASASLSETRNVLATSATFSSDVAALLAKP